MTTNPSELNRLNDLLLESMLREALQPTNTVDLEEKFKQLWVAESTHSRPDNSPDIVTVELVTENHRSTRRWLILATSAAVILLAFFLVSPWSNSNAAQASLQRIIQSKPTNRSYSVTLQNQFPIWGERTISVDLFLNDHDQFVIKHPGWKGFGPIWIGGHETERWIVPPRGPSVVCSQMLISRWMEKRDMPSPHLHLSTMLSRMYEGYELQQLANTISPCPNQSLQSVCVHLIGRNKSDDRRLPESIEVWADSVSGVVHQSVLRWIRPSSDRGPVQWTITLNSIEPISSDFFTYESHQSLNKRVIQIVNENEISKIDDEGSL